MVSVQESYFTHGSWEWSINCHTNEQAKCTCSKRSTAGDIDLATQAIHFTDPMLPVLSKSRVDSLRVIKECADDKEM